MKIGNPMLIDDFVPYYQIGREHETIVGASADTVFEVVSSLDMRKSKWIKTLFQLRGLPYSALTLDGLQKIGFTKLGETPGREFLLGIAGKFWTLGGDLQQLTPAAFKNFDRKGHAKAVWNFSTTTIHLNKTRLETETRIYCLDRESYMKFRCYWLVIGPFSSWIRKEMLKIIKKEAEQAV